jgi:hypothetical protein
MAEGQSVRQTARRGNVFQRAGAAIRNGASRVRNFFRR